MCYKIVSEDPFKFKYCHYRYKTQEMCSKAVDDFLPALKFVNDWFFISKMIKKIVVTALYAEDNILSFEEYSSNVTFCCNQIGILNIDFNNINLDDNNYDEDGPETTIHIRLLAWNVKFENANHLKKI